MFHNRIVFTVTLGELSEVPGSPYAYWAPKLLRGLFKRISFDESPPSEAVIRLIDPDTGEIIEERNVAVNLIM